MDGPEQLADWLEALPVAAVLLHDRRVAGANPAARQLAGGDARCAWAKLGASLPVHAPAGAVCLLDPLTPCGPVLEAVIGAERGAHRVVLLRPAGADGTLHRRLERRLEFERLLTSGSAELMRSGEASLDEAIESVLGNVGRFFDVDRAYVFLLDEAAGTQSNTHEWTAPGVSRESHNLQAMPVDTFPWLLASLRRDEVFDYPRIEDLPCEAVAERAEFEREGIRSILIVPLWSGGQLRGFIGFDAVRRQVDWDESYVVGLRLLAQMLAGAIDARALARELRRRAMHDALTGLPNRLYLHDRFGTGSAWQVPTLVAVVDIDDFKSVNDRFGHAAGDALLRELGRRLAGALAADGVVARVGGDEFVVVQPSRGGCAGDLAARLVDVTAAPFEIGGNVHRAGVSIGVARSGSRHDRLDALLERADVAMYRAKAAGKNRWMIADAQDATRHAHGATAD